MPKVFYKKLLYRPTTLTDLYNIDTELGKGLQLLLDYTPSSEVETVFCRTFEVAYEVYGEERTYELIEGGKNIAVTGENRTLYVKKYVEWLLDVSIKTQFEALFQGFSKVIRASSLLLLSPDELELLMVSIIYMRICAYMYDMIICLLILYFTIYHILA